MANNKKSSDITKTGAQSYRDLQKQNNASLNGEAAYASDVFNDDWRKKNNAFTGAEGAYLDQLANTQVADQHIKSSLYNPETGDYFGNSIFDDDVVVRPDIDSFNQDLGDIRAENEPWYAKIAAGVGKAAVTFGTTLAGTVGLVYGLGQGIYNEFDGDENTGFLDGLWNNPINNALQAISDFSEEWMPNYYTRYEQEHPFTFNANFLGDKIIKNMGFMIGAFYGGIPLSSGLGKIGTSLVKATRAKSALQAERMAEKASKTVAALKAEGKAAQEIESILAKKGLSELERKAAYLKGLDKARTLAGATKATTQVIGSLSSAVVEGSIEAINNSRDWERLEKQKATDELEEEKAAIIEEYGEGTPETIAAFEELDKKHAAKLKAIEQERLKVGNADLLMNLPILTLGNIIQFSKLYSRGFKEIRRKANLTGTLREGNLATAKTWKGGIWKAFKNALVEGNEEFMQRAASDAAGNAASKSIAEWAKSDKEYESNWDTLDYIKSFGQAMLDNSTNASALEEFTIGAISAAIGMPVFGKSNTRNAWVGKNKNFGLSGGLVGEVKDYMHEKSREEKLAAYLNERAKDPAFLSYYKGLVQHHKWDDLMQEALRSGNKKAYKDADFDQLFTDLNAISSAGKLEEFKAMVGYNTEYTDEELDDIVKNTTGTRTAGQQRAEDENALQRIEKNIQNVEASIQLYSKSKQGDIGFEESQTKLKQLEENKNELEQQQKEIEQRLSENKYSDKKVGAFVMQDGTSMNATEDGKKQMREILEKNRTSLLQAADDFVKIRDDIDIETDGQLDDDQISLLSYVKAKILNIDTRSADIKDTLFGENGVLTALSKTFQADLANLNTVIANLEEGLEANPQNKEKLKNANKTKERLESLINMCKKGATATSEEFQAMMMNHLNLLLLYQEVSDPKHALSLSQVKEAQNALLDLTILANEKVSYNKKLNEFLGNPSAINEAYRSAQNQVSQETINKQAEDLYTQIKDKAKTVRDIYDLLSDPKLDSRVVESVMKKINDSEDTGLKDMVKDYNNLNKVFSTFKDILYRKQYPPEILNSIEQSVDEIFRRALEINDEDILKTHPDYKGRADFLVKELENLAELYKNNNQKDLANKVKEILSDYKEAKKMGNKQKNTSKKQQQGNKQKNNQQQSNKTSNNQTQQNQQQPSNPNNTGNNQGATQNNTSESKDDVLFGVLSDMHVSLTTEELLTALENIGDFFKSIDAISKYNEAHQTDGLAITEDDLLKLIQQLLEQRGEYENQEIDEARQSDNETNQNEVSDRSEKMRQQQATSYTSYVVTKYRIFDNDNQLMTSREKYEPTDEQGKLVQKLLEEYGAYDFVDKGYLGIIANELSPDIFYLKSTDPKLAGAVFLAIEYNIDAEKKISKHLYNDKKIKDDATIHTIKLDYNGKKKKFQIVGQLGRTASATDEVKASFDKLTGMINDEFEESKKNSKLASQPFIVSTKYKNKITSINTGRLELSDENRSLYDFMSESIFWKTGGTVKFAVVENGHLDKYFSGINPNDSWLRRNKGAVLMYVRKADGEYYPVRCTRRTVKEWFDKKANATQTGRELLDEILNTDYGNSYIASIVHTIEQLLDKHDFCGQIRAKTLLSKYFILGKASPIQVNTETGEVTVFGYAIDAANKSKEDAVREVFEILADNGAMFTLPSKSWGLTQDTRSIVESGIMEIGLGSYDNFNTSFNINPVDSEGNPIEPNTSHTRTTSQSNPNYRGGKVEIGGTVYRYSLDENGRFLTLEDEEEPSREIPLSEEERVRAIVFKDTYTTYTQEMSDKYDLSAREFTYFNNVRVLKDSDGNVIAYYDENLPIGQRLIDISDKKSILKLQAKFVIQAGKYAARKAKESLSDLFNDKKKSNQQQTNNTRQTQQEDTTNPVPSLITEAPEGDYNDRLSIVVESNYGTTNVVGNRNVFNRSTGPRTLSRKGQNDSHGNKRTEDLEGVDIYDYEAGERHLSVNITMFHPANSVIVISSDRLGTSEGRIDVAINTWRPLTAEEKEAIQKLVNSGELFDKIDNSKVPYYEIIGQAIDDIMMATEQNKGQQASEEESTPTQTEEETPKEEGSTEGQEEQEVGGNNGQQGQRSHVLDNVKSVKDPNFPKCFSRLSVFVNIMKEDLQNEIINKLKELEESGIIDLNSKDVLLEIIKILKITDFKELEYKFNKWVTDKTCH